MTKKRKRSRATKYSPGVNCKKRKTDSDGNGSILTEHPTLCLYYPRISTLRVYLLSSLPISSRSRRRKIASIGRHQRYAIENTRNCDLLCGAGPPHRSACSDQLWLGGERCLATLLDKTLVCTVEDDPRVFDDSREKDFASFSQQANLTARSSFERGTSSISEVGKRKLQLD